MMMMTKLVLRKTPAIETTPALAMMEVIGILALEEALRNGCGS